MTCNAQYQLVKRYFIIALNPLSPNDNIDADILTKSLRYVRMWNFLGILPYGRGEQMTNK